MTEPARPSRFGRYADWWNSLTDTKRTAIKRGIIGQEDVFNAGWDAALSLRHTTPTQPAASEERLLDTVERLRAALDAAPPAHEALALLRILVAIDRETEDGIPDCIAKDGTPYQSEMMARLVADAKALLAGGQ